MEDIMAEQGGGNAKKAEQSFGLDNELVAKLDWKRALGHGQLHKLMSKGLAALKNQTA
jgi:hypothetical protein